MNPYTTQYTIISLPLDPADGITGKCITSRISAYSPREALDAWLNVREGRIAAHLGRTVLVADSMYTTAFKVESPTSYELVQA